MTLIRLPGLTLGVGYHLLVGSTSDIFKIKIRMSKWLEGRSSCTPHPLRTPSPDVGSTTIDYTRHLDTRITVRKQKLPSSQRNNSSRDENQEQFGQFTHQERLRPSGEVHQKDIPLRKTQMQNSRPRIPMQDQKYVNLNDQYTDALLKRIDQLQDQNSQLWEKVGGLDRRPFDNQGELNDVKDYVVSQFNSTIDRLRGGIDHRLVSLTARLNMIDQSIGTTNKTHQKESIQTFQGSGNVTHTRESLQNRNKLYQQHDIVARISSLEVQNTKLHQQPDHSLQKSNQPKQRVSDAREDLKDSVSFEHLVQQNDSLADQNNKLSKKLKMFQIQHKKLKEDLNYCQNQVVTNQGMALTMGPDNSAYLRQRVTLQEEIFHLTNQLRNVAAKDSQLSAPAIESSESEYIRLLQDRNIKLSEQNQELRRLKQLACREKDQLKAQFISQPDQKGLVEYKKQIQALLLKNKQLAEDMEVCSRNPSRHWDQAQIDSLQNKYNQLLTQYNSVRDQRVEVQVVIGRLGEEVAQLKQRLGYKSKEQEVDGAFLKELLGGVNGVRDSLSSLTFSTIKTYVINTENRHRRLTKQLITQAKMQTQHQYTIRNLGSELKCRTKEVASLEQKVGQLNLMINQFGGSDIQLEPKPFVVEESSPDVADEVESVQVTRLRHSNNQCLAKINQLKRLASNIQSEIRQVTG